MAQRGVDHQPRSTFVIYWQIGEKRLSSMGSGGGRMSVGSVRRKKWLGRACLAMLGGGVLGQDAQAGEIWTGGTALNDNKWSTADNWSPAGAPVNDGTANIMMMGPMHPDSLVDVPWSINSLWFQS